jgi:hypothetical protein
LSRRTRFVLVITVSIGALLGGTLAALAATGRPAASGDPASTRANARAAQSPAPYISCTIRR